MAVKIQAGMLKWAGWKGPKAKEHLVPRMDDHGPRKCLRIPFAGGLGFAINAGRYERVVCTDNNLDLIELYKCVKYHFEDVMGAAAHLFSSVNNNPKTYYALRYHFNMLRDFGSGYSDYIEKAALFLFLNKFGFRGLCRYSELSGFNVPFGWYKRVPKLPVQQMVFLHQWSQSVSFYEMGFHAALSMAQEGCHVYCDPPYFEDEEADVPSFTAYSNGNQFLYADQFKLAGCVRSAQSRGALVVVSNRDCPSARSIYQGAEIYTLKARNQISVGERKQRNEIVAVFKPKQGAVLV